MPLFFAGYHGHFDAVIEIYPLEKSGRKRHPNNGIRWAFAYAEDFADDVKNGFPPRVSDIWPEFLDENGKPYQEGVPLMGKLKARMHIIFPNMVDVHMRRLKIGTKFFSMEGARPCADGIVTSVS